jgi:multidrug efflux system membrane fusion protein
MPLLVPAVGNVEAMASVAVKARVSGPVVQVHFEEGQEVKEGDLLFTLDPVPFQVALKQAQAQLARDQASAANARAEFRRQTGLAQKGFLSDQDLDALRAKAESLEATVQGDRALIESTELQIQYAEIRAPLSGRTGAISAPKGTLIKASDDNKSLVTIHQMQPIRVSFSLPEKYLVDIRAAAEPLEVLVRIPDGSNGAGGGDPLRGPLTFIDNSVDLATGAIRLKATMPNEDRRLWPGQFVQVSLILKEQTGVVVPDRAVNTGQAGSFVFVLKEDDTVESRPVTVIRTASGEALVGSGVASGERVVTDGQFNLVNGAKVTVRTPGEPPAAGPGKVSEKGPGMEPGQASGKSPAQGKQP